MIIGNHGVTPGNRKFVISIWVAAVMIIEMLGFYVHSMRSQMSYWKYLNHREQYIILEAVVVEKQRSQIYYNDTFPIFKIFKVKLEYQINGHIYYNLPSREFIPRIRYKFGWSNIVKTYICWFCDCKTLYQNFFFCLKFH